MYTGKIVAESAELAFHKILCDLKKYGTISSPRGHKIVELENVNIIIENPRARIISCPERQMSMAYAFGELAWYLSGRNDLKTMKYYSKFLENCSDDGETLNSAYGFRIFTGRHEKIGFDQWDNCKRLLSEDNDTRQAVIHLHTPNDKKTKDEVCTLSLQFLIRDGKLNMITTMRSNDIVLGFTYDVFAFTMLQEMMADELNVELGYYCHNVGSMHLYLDDYYGNGKFNFLKNGHTFLGSDPMNPISSNEMKKIIKAESGYRNCVGIIIENDWSFQMKCDFIKVKIDEIIQGEYSEYETFYRSAFLMRLMMKIKCRIFEDYLVQRLHDAGYEKVSDMMMYMVKCNRGGKKIIVEGPDKVGKSTYISENLSLYALNGFNIIHFAAPSKNFNFLHNYMSHLITEENEIVDRNFISEIVYSDVMERECRINQIEGDLLLAAVNRPEYVKMIFIVAKGVEQKKILLSRIENSEDKMFLDKILKINERYIEIARAMKKAGMNVILLDMNYEEIE